MVRVKVVKLVHLLMLQFHIGSTRNYGICILNISKKYFKQAKYGIQLGNYTPELEHRIIEYWAAFEHWSMIARSLLEHECQNKSHEYQQPPWQPSRNLVTPYYDPLTRGPLFIISNSDIFYFNLLCIILIRFNHSVFLIHQIQFKILNILFLVGSICALLPITCGPATCRSDDLWSFAWDWFWY